jgi:hypothetical protein
MVPSDGLNRSRGSISLHCSTKVLRVEPLEAGVYGIACLIEDYTVVRSMSTRPE